MEQEEMSVLRGVVYMTKSSGPRTALGDAAGGQVGFTFYTEAAR